MTLLELVTHLRVSILDDTGGSGVSWADITEDGDDVYQLRWSNEELTRLINQAEKDACRAADLIKTYLNYGPVTIVAGTPSYTLDEKIYKVKAAKLASTGKFLTEVEIEDLTEVADYGSKQDTPTHYATDQEADTILLYPEPIVNDTVTLITYRYPASDYLWDTAETQSSELRPEHQIPMLWQAAYYAYQKDEANTFDPARGEYFRNKFNQQFTPESAYSETRRRRSRGRTTKYKDVL